MKTLLRRRGSDVHKICCFYIDIGYVFLLEVKSDLIIFELPSL